jgi:hypothetical protein
MYDLLTSYDPEPEDSGSFFQNEGQKQAVV